MEKLRKVIYITLCIIAVVVMLAALLSIFRDTPNRYLKMLDFPRLQFFWLSLVSFILFIAFTKRWRWYDYALLIGLAGGMIVQARYVINYTPLVDKTVPDAPGDVSDEDAFSILILNVKMSNRNAAPVVDLIRERRADVVLLMETDDWWAREMEPIGAQYVHMHEVINDLAYGMMIYSNLPWTGVKVNYLNNEGVPSFQVPIRLRNGREMLLYAAHPVPPTRYSNLPDNEGQREVAMEKVGEIVTNQPLPAVIAGDLNDVVWSQTDALMGTDNLLQDVRVGRGFYNSFDADNPLLRYPLDHVFVTQPFQVKHLERLPSVGSDHFPIWVELVLPRS